MPNAIYLPFWQFVKLFKRNTALLYIKMPNGTIIANTYLVIIRYLLIGLRHDIK